MSVITVTIPTPGGTATIVDETYAAVLTLSGQLDLQLAAVNGQLTLLNQNLVAQTAAITAMTTSLELNLGPPGLLVPGTMSNSSYVGNSLIANMADELIAIKRALKESNTALGSVSFAVASVSSVASEANAISQLAVADQMSKNAFEKAATKEALVRAGLPEPAPEPIDDTISENAKIASAINASTEVTGYIEQKLRNGFERATFAAVEMITQSTVGIYAASKFTAFKTWIFGDPLTAAKDAFTSANNQAGKLGVPTNPTVSDEFGPTTST
jgi:hypothetical protein